MNSKLLLIVTALASIGLLAACSTAEGFGRDLQKVGKRMENRADATGGTAPEPAPATTPAPAPAN
jgi:predicted small secreted protein